VTTSVIDFVRRTLGFPPLVGGGGGRRSGRSREIHRSGAVTMRCLTTVHPRRVERCAAHRFGPRRAPVVPDPPDRTTPFGEADVGSFEHEGIEPLPRACRNRRIVVPSTRDPMRDRDAESTVAVDGEDGFGCSHRVTFASRLSRAAGQRSCTTRPSMMVARTFCDERSSSVEAVSSARRQRSARAPTSTRRGRAGRCA